MARDFWGVRWVLASAIAILPSVSSAQEISAEQESARLARQYWDARQVELDQERSAMMDRTPLPSSTPPTIDAKPKDKGPTQPFGGIEFGVGVSLTLDRGDRDRVSEAVLDTNGIVRVADQNNNPARIMLESHYFFTPCGRSLLGRKNLCSDNAESEKLQWGAGPFIALQPGGENVIDAIGMGLMIGFRRGQTSQSFNFGIGYVVDPNTKVLGNGISEDQPLPAGETEIRLKETAQSGLLFLASFSF